MGFYAEISYMRFSRIKIATIAADRMGFIPPYAAAVFAKIRNIAVLTRFRRRTDKKRPAGLRLINKQNLAGYNLFTIILKIPLNEVVLLRPKRYQASKP